MLKAPHQDKCSPFLSPNKNIFSQTQKKTVAGSHIGTVAALAIKKPYMDLQIDSHLIVIIIKKTYIYIFIF